MVPRSRDRAVVPGPDARVPVGAGPAEGSCLNVLSVGAAYGVLVAVFQWGWGASLIGVHETVPIMPLAPMLMFAILFGLSMDYEVFLLSRVREQYLKHRDPKRAVVEGVGSTARVITSAALIMISVFARLHPGHRRHRRRCSVSAWPSPSCST